MDVNEMKLKAKLAEKLATVADEMGAMEQDGHNSFSRFSYTSYQALNARLRWLLKKKGVAIIPSTESHEEREYQNEKGKITTRTVVCMKAEIIDTDTGYSVVAKLVGAANDTGDKSMGKAITEAVKRFEFKLFHVSSVEDVDPDGETVPIEGKKKGKVAMPEHLIEVRSILKEKGRDFDAFLEYLKSKGIDKNDPDAVHGVLNKIVMRKKGGQR